MACFSGCPYEVPFLFGGVVADRLAQKQESQKKKKRMEDGGEGGEAEANTLLRGHPRALGAGEFKPATARHVCFIAEILLAVRGILG